MNGNSLRRAVKNDRRTAQPLQQKLQLFRLKAYAVDQRDRCRFIDPSDLFQIDRMPLLRRIDIIDQQPSGHPLQLFEHRCEKGRRFIAPFLFPEYDQHRTKAAVSLLPDCFPAGGFLGRGIAVLAGGFKHPLPRLFRNAAFSSERHRNGGAA